MPLAGRMKLKHFLIICGVLGLTGGGLLLRSMRHRPAQSVVSEQPAHQVPGQQVPTQESYREVLLGHQGTDLRTDKRQDIQSDQPWKANLYQDKGFNTVNRAKVDLDRDGKWDEKWTFKPNGKISKKVAPKDDENYSQGFVWSGNAWKAE